MKIHLQSTVHVCAFTVSLPVQVSEGPNPAIEDLSPDRGTITIPVGQAVVHFSILIKDDQVLIRITNTDVVSVCLSTVILMHKR